MSGKLKAAVIGASGIGKHHAKWYALEGLEVVAFAGSTPETVARTGRAMAELFGFSGRGYTSVTELLTRERPDVVSVCSPHVIHRQHTVQCLEAGAAVLCEKPLVWDVAMDRPQMLAQARLMLEAAARTGRLLAINTQYVAVVPALDRLFPPHAPITDLYFRMESKGGVSGPNKWDEIWIDLASHPLSLVLAYLPGCTLDEDSITCHIREDETVAEFRVKASTGPCRVRIDLRNVYEGPLRRQVGVNGTIADLAGRNDEHGVYRTYLKVGEQEASCDDLVQICIRRFLGALAGQGEPLATADEGYRNLDFQLAIFERAERG